MRDRVSDTAAKSCMTLRHQHWRQGPCIVALLLAMLLVARAAPEGGDVIKKVSGSGMDAQGNPNIVREVVDDGDEQGRSPWWSSYSRRSMSIGGFGTVDTRDTYTHRSLLVSHSTDDEKDALPDLYPLQWNGYLGFGLAFLGLMLAAGGGIGGGGILVPLYILILRFPVKNAIPLASVTVLGGAIANNLLNNLNGLKKEKSGPIRMSNLAASGIDWDLIMQMEPMTIAGALIGADLNNYLPDIVVVVLLLLLLTITAHKTLTKANKLYHQETAELNRKAQMSPTASVSCGVSDPEEGDSLLKVSPPTPTRKMSPEYGAVVSPAVTDDASSSSDGSDKGDMQLMYVSSPSDSSENRNQVLINATKLTILFAAITVINLLSSGAEDGGDPTDDLIDGLPQCSQECFWFLHFLMLVLICAFAVMARSDLLYRIENDEPLCSDIAWDADNTVHYASLAVTAGLVAGMFGIGGGIVKGPLMLALGVDPSTASATSACMILFTSSTASISYAVLGLLDMDYAFACLMLGFIATLVGQTIMGLLLKRYKRNSYIAYSIGLVVVLSAVCMTVESVIALEE